MKKIFTFLLALTFSGFGFAQDFPIDFESGAYTFTDFDGGAVTVIANPQSSGINTSATVAQMVKSTGQTWGGSFLTLSGNVDFTTNQVFTMKVYSPRVGVPVLFKLENAVDGNVATGITVNTTVANEWETLSFDFSGSTSDLYSKLVLIFENGTMGDGSADWTFLFDDIEFSPSSVVLPSLPIDFETGTFSFIDFDGGVASVIANPQSSGINTSATVAQIVRDGGEIWGGSKLILNSKIDFSEANAFSMKVYSTRADVPVLFKLEGDGVSTQLSVNTTVANDWETLTWDFTGQPSDTYNTLVFMFDFGTVGDGTANSIFLFDDIEQVDASGGLTQIDMPVDFEDETVNYTMTDFGGNVSSLVADPDDAANTVAKVIKSAGSQTWAGTTIGTALGFATALPLTSTETEVSIMVYSPTAGIQIRLKAEDHNDPTLTVETEATTTVANAWEELVFDFSNVAAETNPYNPATTFDKVSIFFNFNIPGTDEVYYFDDVEMYSTTTGFNELNPIDFRVYPNPASDYLYISNSSDLKRVDIYSVTGQKVRSFEYVSNKIQIAELPQGVYLLSAESTSGEIFISKFFKN